MQKKTTFHDKKPLSAVPSRHIFLILAWSAGTVIMLAWLMFGYNAYVGDRIPPGTRVGNQDIGGLSAQAAKDRLSKAAAVEIDRGLSVRYQATNYPIPSTIDDATNPELATAPLYAYDIVKTVASITAASQQFNPLEKAFYAVFGWHVKPSMGVNRALLASLLLDKLGSFESPAKNAKLVIGTEGTLSVQPEAAGQAFRYDLIIDKLTEKLNNFSSDPVDVTLELDAPTISKTEGEKLVPLAKQIMDAAPFAIVYGQKNWPLTRELVIDWLEFQSVQKKPSVGLNVQKLTDFIETIAKEVDVQVSEGKFTMSGGKVTTFSPSQAGVEVQVPESATAVNDKIRQVGIKEVDLRVKETQPQVAVGNVNDLGIKEIIGEGHSNFKGSPTNRRHNIKTGADKLNGILIKPDEEFSLVKTLGAIDASTGYLPELVIKGNKTTPEFGGGLCQIGTTTFRAALDAGLPILERTSHSYRVVYYEPAGTDATIYDPKPDFRFKNDTGHYILFTTEIKGDDLYFRFYGTKDGRTVTQTTPRVFNLKSPAPKKIIETTDLAPGKTKCTEKAHVGADAEFSRTVTYADGSKKVDVFKSHYKPWQEVCLVGVAKSTSKPAPTLPTPDNPVIIPTNSNTNASPSSNTNANTNSITTNTNSTANTNTDSNTNAVTNVAPTTNTSI